MKQKIRNFVLIKMSLKKTITVLLLFLSISITAQEKIDSLKEQIDVQDGKMNAMDDRLTATESTLSKLSKIKFSGYVQAQYEDYGADLIKPGASFNSFYIRRARIKLTYEATDGVKFVLCPDYSTGNLTLKDAYVVANLPSIKGLALWVGQFNRPVYEVEYSSSQREVAERSLVIRNLYPGEREIGAKLEYQPNESPLKIQVALLNGNFTGTEAKDIDSRKDLMVRATYSLKIPSQGIGIDFGAHAYYGGLKAQTKYVSGYDGAPDTTYLNKYMDKQWAGAEMQVYFDFLGGMSLKGEYIQGKNAYNVVGGGTAATPYKMRNFSGYYAYLIKNIGKKNQAVIRYDYFDPNTKVSGQNAGSEVYYKTFNFAWQYYLNENIRITLNYAKPTNEITQTITKDLSDDVFTLRFQAKF